MASVVFHHSHVVLASSHPLTFTANPLTSPAIWAGNDPMRSTRSVRERWGRPRRKQSIEPTAPHSGAVVEEKVVA